MDILSAIILGFVEGLTEFLPVSSTGHLILTSKILGLENSDTLKSFEVVIQLGSILAVVFLFFSKLRQDFSLWIKLALGFVPTALVGFLLYKTIKSLFDPTITAYMLIFYGVIFIVVEIWLGKKTKLELNLDEITYKQAFIIGLSQCLAMIPGTSRSGVTILSGLLCGLSRTAAASFSFLLAIPTMFAATLYDLYKNAEIFTNSQNISIFLVGSLTAFLVALVTIKLFLKFIAKFSYISFGVYRIVLGVLFLIFIL